MEHWCPARCHSAVEGPAEAVTVKGEAFISAALQPNQASPPQGAVCTAGYGSSGQNVTVQFLVSKLLVWNDQGSSLQTQLSFALGRLHCH